MEPQENSSSGAGATIGIMIILVLLAFGGYYFWSTQLPKTAIPLSVTKNSVTTTSKPSATTSDETVDIQADLNSIDMKDFDTQMNADLTASQASL